MASLPLHNPDPLPVNTTNNELQDPIRARANTRESRLPESQSLSPKHSGDKPTQELSPVLALWRSSDQGHLGIYYYIETRSYGMFDARATTFLVLGYRSTGKLTSRSLTTT